MGERVTTPILRFGFVQKSASEVGAGTAYPAQATLDQIAEIFYRVKDIKFSGQFSWIYDAPVIGAVPMTFTAPVLMPINRTVEAGGLQTRGYSMLGADPYNNPIYDAGAGYFYSDIGSKESGMWRDRWNEDIIADPMYQYITHTCVTAFTYSSDNNNPPDATWWGYGGVGGKFTSRMGRNIAIVKTNPANGFFDPTNQFYIEFEIDWDDYGYPVNFGGGSNINNGIKGNWSSYADAAGNYTIRLKSGDILVPVYQGNIDSSSHACSVIHEATEWWPSAKDNPPAPVWDSTTGIKL